MRILALTLRYEPYVVGGYEILTRDTVEGLRGMGHEVFVLCGRGREHAGRQGIIATLEPTLDDAGDLFERDQRSAPLERFRSHFFRPANYRAAAAAIRSVQPDLVLYFNLGLVSVAPLVAARFHGLPALGYVCDRWAENLWLIETAAKRNKPVRFLAMKLAWSALRSLAGMHSMLSASDWIREHLLATGVAPTDVGVLPTGLAPELWRLSEASPRAADREPGEPLRLICTSMLWSGKGQHVLVQALGSAVAEGLDAELVIAGQEAHGGEYVERLTRLIGEGGIEERVEFVGMLEPEQLSARLGASHVFVLPSIWGEPFGMVTIEAMAHGLCTVVTDSGASPELVGDAGVVVATDDVEALTRVLLALGEDEQRRRELGLAARARAVQRFGRDVFLEHLDAACRAVAAGRAPESFGERPVEGLGA